MKIEKKCFQELGFIQVQNFFHLQGCQKYVCKIDQRKALEISETPQYASCLMALAGVKITTQAFYANEPTATPTPCAQRLKKKQANTNEDPNSKRISFYYNIT